MKKEYKYTNKTSNPIDCVLGITYNCNSRCVMCDIWKIYESKFIDPEEYRKLPSSLKDINISGGEPFMHPDIVDVVRVISETCPEARIVISTNGFATGLIEKRMRDILAIKPDIGVAISIDGVGDMHEKIRQIPDAWNRSTATLDRLKQLEMTNLRFAFTVLPQNVTHFSKVYDEANKRGIQFTYSFAQSSEHYFGGKDVDNTPDYDELRKQFEHVLKSELKSWNPKKWARAYFGYGLFNFATKKNQILKNEAGEKFFFMDPKGVIYPSVVDNIVMGNICDLDDWDKLWNSKRAFEARDEVKKNGAVSWMICTARTAIKRHPFKVGFWVMKNKFVGINL